MQKEVKKQGAKVNNDNTLNSLNDSVQAKLNQTPEFNIEQIMKTLDAKKEKFDNVFLKYMLKVLLYIANGFWPKF